MKASLQQVLDKLIAKKARGITFDDFHTGKVIAKRISELREMGYNIQVILETLPSGCRRARYFLLGKAKP